MHIQNVLSQNEILDVSIPIHKFSFEKDLKPCGCWLSGESISSCAQSITHVINIHIYGKQAKTFQCWVSGQHNYEEYQHNLLPYNHPHPFMRYVSVWFVSRIFQQLLLYNDHYFLEQEKLLVVFEVQLELELLVQQLFKQNIDQGVHKRVNSCNLSFSIQCFSSISKSCCMQFYQKSIKQTNI